MYKLHVLNKWTEFAQRIAVITVAPTGKASFVYSYA